MDVYPQLCLISNHKETYLNILNLDVNTSIQDFIVTASSQNMIDVHRTTVFLGSYLIGHKFGEPLNSVNRNGINLLLLSKVNEILSFPPST